MKKEQKKEKPIPIKKVPLIIGLVFVVLGLVNLILVFFSLEERPTYATLVVAFVGFGITLLDKSGILER